MSVINEIMMEQLVSYLILGDVEFQYQQKNTQWGIHRQILVFHKNETICSVLYVDEMSAYDIFVYEEGDTCCYKTAKEVFVKIIQLSCRH